MNNTRKTSPENSRDRARLDRAVRRAVGMGFATPSMRSLLRACAMYANVIALAVALGMPDGNLRQAAGSAFLAFDSALRSVNESVFSGPDALAAPVDLSQVTESVGPTVVSPADPELNLDTERADDHAPATDADPVRSGHDPRDSHGPDDSVLP